MLRRDGYEAEHVIECSLDAAPDDDIRNHFKNENLILVSRDSDFWNNTPDPWALIWIHVHNPRILDLATWLYENLKQVVKDTQPRARHIITEDEIISLPQTGE